MMIQLEVFAISAWTGQDKTQTEDYADRAD